MRRFLALGLTLTLLAACAGDTAEPAQPPRTEAPGQTPCEAAFADAASVDSMSDTHEDLFPAYRACATLEEWAAASTRYPGALDGVDPIAYAATVCGWATEVQGSPICASALPDNPTPAPATEDEGTTTQDANSFAREACANTTYEGCEEGMLLMMDMLPGELVAICEYDGGTGDVVLLESRREADTTCSGDGLFSPSRVVDVIRLP